MTRPAPVSRYFRHTVCTRQPRLQRQLSSGAVRSSSQQEVLHHSNFDAADALPRLGSEAAADINVRPAQSAYIHLPFCKRRCYYCDFPIAVIGSQAAAGPSQGIQDYIDLLILEMTSTPVQQQPPLDTVFFGGGTPSLIPPQLLAKVLQTLRDRVGISPTAEISMEADPGTFDVPRLREYMQLGVNRFSIGIQSFQEVSFDAVFLCPWTWPAKLQNFKPSLCSLTHQLK